MNISIGSSLAISTLGNIKYLKFLAQCIVSADKANWCIFTCSQHTILYRKGISEPIRNVHKDKSSKVPWH